MADPKWEDTENWETVDQTPTWEDTESWEEVGAEAAAPQDGGAVETAQDFLTGMADTTVGRVAGGISSGVYDLLSKYIAPESDVDKKLRAEGFDVKEKTPGSAWETFKEGYYGGKESIQKSAEEARERSPIAATTGGITSELAQMALPAKALGVTGKAATKAGEVAKVLGVGALEGAASEASRGDARLLEGDIEGTMKELSEGAQIGTLSAGLGLGAGKLLKSVPGVGKGAKFLKEEVEAISKEADPLTAAKKMFTRAMRPGSGGIKGISKEVQGRAKGLADNIVNTVRKSRTEIGQQIGGLRKLATEQAEVKLDTAFGEIDDVLEKFRSNLPSSTSKTAKDFKKVADYLKSIKTQNADLSALDLKKASKISDELKAMTTNFIDGAEDIKDKELLAIMRDFSKRIDNIVDDEVIEQLTKKYPDRVNEFLRNKDKYSALSDLEAYAGTSTMSGRVKIKGAEKAKAGEALIKKLSDETYDISAMMSEKEISDLLNESGLGKFADEIRSQIKEINAGVQVLQYLNPQGAGFFTTFPRGAAAVGLTTAGKVTGKAKQAARPITELSKSVREMVGKGSTEAQAMVSSMSKWMQNTDSKSLESLGKALENAGKMRFSKVIQDISKMDDPVQKAIRMHAITQQPAFRQDLRGILDLDTKDKE